MALLRTQIGGNAGRQKKRGGLLGYNNVRDGKKREENGGRMREEL